MALGLTLFYVLDDGSDDPLSLAGTGHEMSGQDTDTSDLADYCKAITDSFDPYFGTRQRGAGVPVSAIPGQPLVPGIDVNMQIARRS